MYHFTLRTVRAVNKAAGKHWFSQDSMRFFNSRVFECVYGGRYFVSSERCGRHRRKYTVRMVDDDGLIHTVGDFQQYATRKQAHAAARAFGKEG